jgi:hypothetical protein
MKKRFFYGIAVIMAVAAITFSGISNSNTSVTDFAELRALGCDDYCYCTPRVEECETPLKVWEGKRVSSGD